MSEHEEKKPEDEDVEGHKFAPEKGEPEADVEGHKFDTNPDVMDEPDVEGHKYAPRHDT